MSFLPAEIIKKKRNGAALSSEELDFFVSGFTKGELPDYQMSALLMAIYFQGLSRGETSALTEIMLNSGVQVDLTGIPGFKVDKHSTGGVGDKTSLILAPIVAAAGVKVPMISGRGLGHTGGTLDKLESIPGFSVQQSLGRFVQLIQDHGIGLIGQTAEICPADKKLYSLRDVTATVESLPLICASIMSKKLAEGINGLVLDVKFGSGAFMKDVEDATLLGRGLIDIAKAHGLKIAALLTNMNQPLGRFMGNALEVREALDILSGSQHLSETGVDLYADTRELSLSLSAHMLFLAGAQENFEKCYEMALSVLKSGQAYKKFSEIVQAQGGDLAKLPRAKDRISVVSTEEGYIQEFQTEALGVLGIRIRAGRAVITDSIDPTAGVEFHAKIGDFVQKGQTVFTLHGENRSLLEEASTDILNYVKFQSQKTKRPEVIYRVLTE